MSVIAILFVLLCVTLLTCYLALLPADRAALRGLVRAGLQRAFLEAQIGIAAAREKFKEMRSK